MWECGVIGRRARLKILWGKTRVGSSPTTPIMRPRNKKYVSKKSTKLSKTECDELIVACVVAEHERVLSKKIHDRLIAKLELIKEEIK